MILDTNVYDAAIDNDQLRNLMAKKQESGSIALFSTRIENEELAAIPPLQDRGQKSAVQTVLISPAVFVLDASHLDDDRLGTDEANAAFNYLQNGSKKHTNDAMIGATAMIDADILVTNDHRLLNRLSAIDSKVKVITSQGLFALLKTL
jgi:hypothetical protein